MKLCEWLIQFPDLPSMSTKCIHLTLALCEIDFSTSLHLMYRNHLSLQLSIILTHIL